MFTKILRFTVIICSFFGLLIVSLFVYQGFSFPSSQVGTVQGVTDSLPQTPGAHNLRMVIGLEAREYRLYLPKLFQPEQTYPLIMGFHDHGSDNLNFEEVSQFSQLADQEQFIAVYPQATQLENIRSWNALHCCNPARQAEIKDVLFISKLLDKLKNNYQIDPRQTIATGLGNGGMLAYHLATELPEQFSLIAPVNASIGGKPDLQSESLVNSIPPANTALIVFHGLLNQEIYYHGGFSDGLDFERFDLSMTEAQKIWQTDRNCQDPSTQIESNYQLTKFNCQESLLHWYVLTEQGHQWPESSDFSASQLIWEFSNQTI